MRIGLMNRKMSLRDSYAAKFKREGFPRKPKAGLKRQSTPKPRKALKKVSSARAIAAKVYTAKRRVFLAENPMCQAHGIIWPGLPIPPADDVHHVAGRGLNYLRVETWLAVSRTAHDWIHAHPNTARILGLLK